MAAADTDADIVVAGEGALPRKKINGKVLILFILLPALLVGGGVGAYYGGLLDPMLGRASHVPGAELLEPADPDQVYFYELPEMLVNLDSSGKRTSFLRIRVALELDNKEDTALIEDVLPRVIDNFQVYLRELRVDDLQGSAGLFRLKEELLVRVNKAVAPVRVSDVLFKEMIVQ